MLNLASKIVPPTFILLLSLKLGGAIAVPWVIVFAPLWLLAVAALITVRARSY